MWQSFNGDLEDSISRRFSRVVKGYSTRVTVGGIWSITMQVVNISRRMSDGMVLMGECSKASGLPDRVYWLVEGRCKRWSMSDIGIQFTVMCSLQVASGKWQGLFSSKSPECTGGAHMFVNVMVILCLCHVLSGYTQIILSARTVHLSIPYMHWTCI